MLYILFDFLLPLHSIYRLFLKIYHENLTALFAIILADESVFIWGRVGGGEAQDIEIAAKSLWW